jgi:two-component system, cell cycle sensor histidine kinase and response regulator CckA
MIRTADADVVIPADADPCLSPSSPELRYRELFEGALLAIYVSRPDGALVACNTAFARMLGFESVSDAMGASMSAVYVEPEDRERFVTSVREHGRLEYHRARLRRHDGRVIEVIETVVGEFGADGVLNELRGFLIDVTASLDAELARLDRERQFRAAFSAADDAMLILDDGRRIVDANPAARRLFGAEKEERPLEALLAEPEDERTHLVAAWREMLALGEAKREHRVLSAGSDVRLVECSYRAHVYKNSHLCIVRDITDRRLLEERVVQSQKIESVGRLAGGIAHDFNNLLTAILGYTELLLGTRGERDPERVELEEIQRAGQRAAALTQQLLAFSRKQVLMPKDVNLNETIVKLQTMLARLIREDITLSCRLAPSPAVIKIDPTQLEQAIINLVLNARDALPAGGAITLEVAVVPGTQMELPLDQPGDGNEYVRLRVVDNGVGISPEARAHLFEPFFTTKDVGKGTGLGLASVYGIVRQSNGFIAVESEIGAGSVFTMHFPAVPFIADAPAAPPAGRDGEATGDTVLLVEDEDAVRAIIAAVLRRQGYQVLEASGSVRACELFEEHPQIALLLTDVVMPTMNGPALAQRLIGLRPELRVLFISGYTDLLISFDSHNPNIGFLSKPFRASVLTERVHTILARPGRQSSSQ